MRIWSLHPKYLDPQGLVALWRETLLAQKVLAGKTKGYRNHPQLQRFKDQKEALRFIGTYLHHIYLEAQDRGYSFDQTKISKRLSATSDKRIPVTTGQIDYEFQHLKRKLESRSPIFYAKLKGVERVQLHPLFSRRPGRVEAWEVIPGEDSNRAHPDL